MNIRANLMGLFAGIVAAAAAGADVRPALAAKKRDRTAHDAERIEEAARKRARKMKKRRQQQFRSDFGNVDYGMSRD